MKRLFAFAFVLVSVISAPAAAQVLDVAPTSPPPVATAQAPEAPPPDREHDGGVFGSSAFGIWGEQMDLSGEPLVFGNPEIQAVDGLVLGPEWAGAAALRRQPLGGVSVAVGMRALEYLRGPELRLMFGGGELSDAYAPTSVEGIDVALLSVVVLRLEAAAGFQVPIGPVVPYLLGRAAIGGAWIDARVRDARLGELGTETLEVTTYELGIEAGVGFRIIPGLELGLAFRGSFLGTESLGGMVTIGFDGSSIDDGARGG